MELLAELLAFQEEVSVERKAAEDREICLGLDQKMGSC
jgi:hypothetical protein